ncbi:MAG TPA: hypothetical protein VKU35_06140 [Candidatus Limnocylindria bacterium]|nr:hypothetical protein [Candidatus Limnocylindria bacterium]
MATPPAPAIEHPVRGAWLARLVGRAMGLYLHLVAGTVRLSGEPLPQGQVVFAIWHQDNLAAASAAVKTRVDTRLMSFSTRGFRGIVMNNLLETMRARAITLPDEGRETRAEAARVAKEMAGLAARGFSLVVSCDGPFGPYRVAKPGALLVARESGLPLYPIAMGFRPAWRLRGRWDRHLVPLPFALMRIEHGAVIEVGPRQPLKPLLPELQAVLLDVAERADRWMSRAGGSRT